MRIAVLFPELLGTYGDGGNGRILEQRLRLRGLAVDRMDVAVDQTVPTQADLYVLGGGEDSAQLAALERLTNGQALARAVESGAAVFAVCAGLQILGTELPGADAVPVAGLGLLDLSTVRGEPRAVGEVLATPNPAGPLIQTLSGYENHGGRTHLGSAATSLATVSIGIGNGTADRAEGAVQGRIVATYLHGPALARNPELADHVLGLVAGPLQPLDLPQVTALRAHRLRLPTPPP